MKDLEQADLVVITGSNLAWYACVIPKVKSRQTSQPCIKSDRCNARVIWHLWNCKDIHLALESGSDVALFNGLLAYLDDNDQ